MTAFGTCIDLFTYFQGFYYILSSPAPHVKKMAKKKKKKKFGSSRSNLLESLTYHEEMSRKNEETDRKNV